MFDVHYACLCLIRGLPDKSIPFLSYFHDSVLESQTRNICVRIARKIYVQGRNTGKKAWCPWVRIVKSAIIFQHGYELIYLESGRSFIQASDHFLNPGIILCPGLWTCAWSLSISSLKPMGAVIWEFRVLRGKAEMSNANVALQWSAANMKRLLTWFTAYASRV